MSRSFISPEKEPTDMVQSLEHSYRDRLSEIDFKSRQEQNHYESLEESLRRQLMTLREEIDLKLSRSSKISQTKKSQLDQSLSSLQLSRDQDLQEKSKRLSSIKEKFFRQKQDFESSHSKLMLEKSEAENENHRLRSQITDLSREIEITQARIRDVYNKDISNGKREIEGLKNSYSSVQRKVQQEHGYEDRELQYRVENSDRTIENLLYDIESLKREEEAVRAQTDRDIAYLRESLMDSQKEIEHCEEQTVQLLRSRDDAKDESLMLSRVTGELETELGKEMKTNTRLNGKLTKLERLVYGKGARSPSKNRLA
jgi:chromosome segregation ATPase